MKLLLNLSLSFVFIFTQIYAGNAFADPVASDLRFRAALATDMINQSKTLGQLLTNVSVFMTKEESRGIISYLNKNHVNLETKLPVAKQLGNKIILEGGDELKLLPEARVSYRGKQFKKDKAYDLFIEDIHHRLNESHSLFNFVIPNAEAGLIDWAVAGCIIVALIFVGRNYMAGLSKAKDVANALPQNLRITACEKNDGPSQNKVTFTMGISEDSKDVTKEDAIAAGIPADLFNAFFTACIKEKSVANAKLVKIILDNSKDPVGTAKTVEKTVH